MGTLGIISLDVFILEKEISLMREEGIKEEKEDRKKSFLRMFTRLMKGRGHQLSDSLAGVIFFCKGHLPVSRDILGCHNLERGCSWHLVHGG